MTKVTYECHTQLAKSPEAAEKDCLKRLRRDRVEDFKIAAIQDISGYYEART